jgi:signal transduction histidine kinase
VGIGLSVVREIVTLHRGGIDARSGGLGHGSEFVVTLPAAPPGWSSCVSAP